jgi:hypothetical protein
MLLNVGRPPRSNTAVGMFDLAHDMMRDRRADAGAALAVKD